MKKLFFEFALLNLTIWMSSCSIPSTSKPVDEQSNEKTPALNSRDIIQKSIAFHDPDSHWNQLKAEFHFSSSFSFNDSIPEALEISIDVAKNALRYHNLDRKVDFSFTPDSCWSHQNSSVVSLLSENGPSDCNNYKWTHNFYTYIWGLPMKLNDPGVIPSNKVLTTVINGISCYQVEIAYAAETYQFYFAKENYELIAFEFLKNDNSGKGEYIILEGIYEYNSILFPAKRTWMHLQDRSQIGVNQVDSICPIP